MKKLLSVIISSAIGAAALTAPANTYAQSANQLVILGDSISTGYGLAEDEYNYGEICADYLGWDTTNYAVDGADTNDLYSLITTDAAVRDSIADAETVVVSIGGNDIIGYVSARLISAAAKKGYLKEGFTTDDIPENPSINDLYKMVKLTDEDGGYTGDCYLKYLKDNQMEALSIITSISSNLRLTSGTNIGYIPNTIIPNIEKIKTEIATLNSDAQIIFQTVYQPIQFTEEYYNIRFGTGGPYASLSTAFTLLRTNMVDIMSKMRDQLLLIEGIDLADVYYEFTALEDIATSKANTTQGSAHYFTDIQENDEERDFHPNQKGHLAIAAAVLEQIGTFHDTGNSDLIRSVYEGLEDKADYPAIALETYNLIAGKYIAGPALGDVNGDGEINPTDATLVLQHFSYASMDGVGILDDTYKAVADVNNDGEINPTDATYILTYFSYLSMNGTDSFEDFINK